MKRALIYAASLAAAVFLDGCATIPPGAERGHHGTMAYDVLVEASRRAPESKQMARILETPRCI